MPPLAIGVHLLYQKFKATPPSTAQISLILTSSSSQLPSSKARRCILDDFRAVCLVSAFAYVDYVLLFVIPGQVKFIKAGMMSALYVKDKSVLFMTTCRYITGQKQLLVTDVGHGVP